LAERRISAKEVMIDIRAGLSNDEIGQKYRLSERGIRSLLDKLLNANLLTVEEHLQRVGSSTLPVDLEGDNGGRIDRKQVVIGSSEPVVASTPLPKRLEDDNSGSYAVSTSGNGPVQAAPLRGQDRHETREDFIPTSAKFIDISKQGQNQWWRYLVSILFISVFSTLMTVIAMAMFAPNSRWDNTTGSLIGISSLSNYVLQSLTFVFLFVAIFMVVRIEHKRSFLSLITPNESIDWKKIGKGFGLFFALLSCVLAIDYLMAPESFQFCLDPGRFMWFAPVVLVLTPIQTTAEELLFRGYLLHTTALLTGNRMVLVLVSGALFMLPHLVNPEVAAGFLPMALYYFAVGGFLTIVTLKSNGLEVAIGIHAATNLFVGLIVNYTNSVLKTESIFLCSTLDPVGSLVSFCIIAIIFYLLMFGGRLTLKRFWKKRQAAVPK